jgi:hypothetical protein
MTAKPRGSASATEAGENDKSFGNWEPRGKDPSIPPADRKPGAFTEAIKKLFREVKTALTCKAPAPQPSRRRTEDTGRAAFQMAARKIMRRAVRFQTQAYAAASAYLWDTLDWLNQWHSDPLTHYDPASEDVDTGPSNHLSLHL